MKKKNQKCLRMMSNSISTFKKVDSKHFTYDSKHIYLFILINLSIVYLLYIQCLILLLNFLTDSNKNRENKYLVNNIDVVIINCGFNHCELILLSNKVKVDLNTILLAKNNPPNHLFSYVIEKRKAILQIIHILPI